MKQALSESIGQATRDARARLQITQEDAAERVGVSVEFYSRLERGTSLPSVVTFARMANALGISADRLIGRTESEGSGSIEWAAAPIPDDSAELRSLFRRLRRASPLTLRAVKVLVTELERGLRAAARPPVEGDGGDDDDSGAQA